MDELTLKRYVCVYSKSVMEKGSNKKAVVKKEKKIERNGEEEMDGDRK